MEGAASIRVQLASLWKRAQESGRRFVGYDPLNIYEGSDSGVVVAEFQAKGKVLRTGDKTHSPSTTSTFIPCRRPARYCR